jgi:hypothetical protein
MRDGFYFPFFSLFFLAHEERGVRLLCGVLFFYPAFFFCSRSQRLDVAELSFSALFVCSRSQRLDVVAVVAIKYGLPILFLRSERPRGSQDPDVVSPRTHIVDDSTSSSRLHALVA